MVSEVLMQHTLPTEWNNLKKLFLKNRSRRMSGLCNQNGTSYPVGCIFCSTSNNSKSSPTGPRGRDPNSPSTQSLTFWAGDLRQMGKFLIAIVALAAAEKHLRVFFCGYALLPASGRDRHGEEGKRKKTKSANSCLLSLGANLSQIAFSTHLLLLLRCTDRQSPLTENNLALKYPSG